MKLPHNLLFVESAGWGVFGLLLDYWHHSLL
jgi:hypothetical protein